MPEETIDRFDRGRVLMMNREWRGSSELGGILATDGIRISCTNYMKIQIFYQLDANKVEWVSCMILLCCLIKIGHL